MSNFLPSNVRVHLPWIRKWTHVTANCQQLFVVLSTRSNVFPTLKLSHENCSCGQLFTLLWPCFDCVICWYSGRKGDKDGFYFNVSQMRHNSSFVRLLARRNVTQYYLPERCVTPQLSFRAVSWPTGRSCKKEMATLLALDRPWSAVCESRFMSPILTKILKRTCVVLKLVKTMYSSSHIQNQVRFSIIQLATETESFTCLLCMRSSIHEVWYFMSKARQDRLSKLLLVPKMAKDHWETCEDPSNLEVYTRLHIST